MHRRFLATVLGAFALLLAAGTASAVAASPPEVQSATQSAGSAQQATAGSETTQVQPSNTNISVRVLSPGDDGSVSQTNSASSAALAANANAASQSSSQTQGGAGGIQTADQSATNAQQAGALSATAQLGPSNTNVPVGVLSPGDGGSVTQTNTASSAAGSANLNKTDQTADQSQAGGIQTADQSAQSRQDAAAASQAVQDHPKNTNVDVRVLSPGDDGNVKQSNTVSSTAAAANADATHQDVSQDPSGSSSCGCSSPADVQNAKQQADNKQSAGALSSAKQTGAKNTNVDVRVLSPGDNGSVDQSNSVDSSAHAANLNATKQTVDQSQAGGSSGCGCAQGDPIQIADQSSTNEQAAFAGSFAKQEGAKNANTPVRVGSPGDDGSVKQSNDASSAAVAANANGTHQSVDQDQAGSSGHDCGCQGSTDIQVSGQKATSDQAALAHSATAQIGASNSSSPTRVKSPGNEGSVKQSNDASSAALAANLNTTHQDVDQDPTGSTGHGCGCESIGIQAAGQKAVNEQAAKAGSLTVQDFGRSECGCPSGGNSSSPTRVHSGGGNGSVSQANDASSAAAAGNLNLTDQSAHQSQSGGSGIGIQALGQQAFNLQRASAASATFQLGASNASTPTRVYSPGDDGTLHQRNDAASAALSGNVDRTSQYADQSLGGSDGCGCGSAPQIQVAGQSAGNWQSAHALSATFQVKPKNAGGGVSVWSPGKGGSTWQTNDARSLAGTLNLVRLDQLALQHG